ncbi:DinB family protein [Pyrinomonas methylaliphatogenes]|uniref:Damage-inducible protein DinB n=1 Tax=Pyrinomonas methylaliphatogenes TaxID=454194 RepID=A0A0B6WYQ1_9BACT|nr:DinB family protein [Pyrinomonas methylaliphatogenes]CDM66393.1 hypothetical protein PYK22_02423 [Pyrinomonas methylaliphatogenes]
MTISELFLPEFEQEVASTRRTLERVPDDRFDWRPHEKSMTMGALATHVANIPSWARVVIETDAFDVIGPDGKTVRAPEVASREELLKLFEQNVEAARRAIAAASDEELAKAWALRAGEQTLFTAPRFAVLRRMVFNHLIHHRAQLGVYLRLNGIPVPSVYGPSADEA